VKPQRASDPIRLALVLLACCFAWREALTIAQPPWFESNHSITGVTDASRARTPP
jgi:hypothetical protein